MKSYTFKDKSVAYFYEVGDKVKLSRDYIVDSWGKYDSTIKKGTPAEVTEILGHGYIELNKKISVTGLISLVTIKYKVKQKKEEFYQTVRLHVWFLEPLFTIKELTKKEAIKMGITEED